MLRFQHIYYLLGLGVLPLVILLFIGTLLWRKNKLRKLGDDRLVKEQLRGYIPGRTTLRFTLMALALCAAIIGWANLQMGAKADKVQRKGVDVIIALDVSKSMLAKDIQPDRLTRAKQLITRMLDKMENDRVGLVIFAGRSYLQVPLTVDYSSMRMLLQNVRPDLVPTQGTVISDAIDLAMKSFSQKEKKYKSLVIISDGEDHDENALAKTKAAADAGVIVHTVGIGSPQGSTLYDEDTKSNKLDENGAPVITKLNEAELQGIAAAGRGTYTLLNNTDNVANKLMDEIEGMEQRNIWTPTFTDYTSFFQYFLGFAFIMLLIEFLFPGSKIKSAVGKKMKTVVPVILLFVCAISPAHAQQEKSLLKEGNKLYEQKNYKEAAQAYEHALMKNPTSTIGMFNLGNALYNQKNLEGTRKAMSAAALQSKDSQQKADAHYNIGNTYMDEKKWQEALDAYKQALRNNPQDADAKYNLSYAQQMLKEQQKKDKDKNKDKDKKDDKKKDKDKQDQDKKNQDKKDDKKDDKDKQDEQNKEDKQDQQKPQPQPSKLSKEQAAQILNALQQEEKNLQDKQQKAKGIPVKVEKDW